LEQQSVGAEDVDFFACHQPTIWFRQVIQDHVGMSRARTFDTYPEAGTVSAANIPLILDRARGLDLLREGDLVAFFQGGTGATHAASLVRW
jgi:3-oxoacyl-[acyl-carrier-protein] synthase III